MNMPRPISEQGAPPSIRDLAEQRFAIQQADHRENSVRRQRDDTLFRRTMDPTLSRTRENRPDATTMPKFNPEVGGLLQKQDLRRREPEREAAEPVATPPGPSKPVVQISKPPTLLHRVGGYCSDNKMIVFLVILAVVGCIVLVGCDWKKHTPASAASQ